MKEFIIGFLCGMIFLVIILPLISKLVARRLVKRKINDLDSFSGGLLGNLMDKFQNMQDGSKENSKIIEGEDISSERATNGSSKTDI